MIITAITEQALSRHQPHIHLDYNYITMYRQIKAEKMGGNFRGTIVILH